MAPLLVLIGRLLRGFSAGAELGGVSVYLAEIATGAQRFHTSWQSGTVSRLPSWSQPQWASRSMLRWSRAPSALAYSVPVWLPDRAFIFIMRRRLEKRRSSARAVIIWICVRYLVLCYRTGRWVIAGMLMVAMTTTAYLVPSCAFGKVLMLSASDSLLVTLLVAISNFIWLPIGGALSDRWANRCCWR